ncbi:MAG: glycosyltransferase family 39 protein [Alcaligenaceae bacterium]|nr:glycosyltransferase family 39 protein [Alcaligenaceae bacterium]
MRKVNLWWGLAVLLCMPLISMELMPLADTSEPRYAEIARLMVVSGDWITPWFEPGKPFWGKPVLSFWAQALAFRALGVNEFAARLPSWLCMLATVLVLTVYANTVFGKRVAQWSAIIYSSCVLVYVTSGAVLTDPFLVLGTTLCMSSLMMAGRKQSVFWRYGFFIGVSVGLLAKGPLVLVLVSGPLILWLLPDRNRFSQLKALPWKKGLLLTAIISLPWYILAEIKTPGFLNYFIIGEHFLRYIDPGWQGDLYGTAHQNRYGTIWWFWLQATFPWGLLAIALLLPVFFRKGWRMALKPVPVSSEISYLLVWALFTPLFFTFSGNILWTYVLPCIGAFSVLMAIGWLKWVDRVQSRFASMTGWAAGIVPLVLLLLSLVVHLNPGLLKTERELIHFAERQEVKESVYYVDERPFSARFYSGGKAGLLKMDELSAKLAGSDQPLLLAVPKKRLDMVSPVLLQLLQKRFENKRYVLFERKPLAGRHRLSVTAN